MKTYEVRCPACGAEFKTVAAKGSEIRCRKCEDRFPVIDVNIINAEKTSSGNKTEKNEFSGSITGAVLSFISWLAIIVVGLMFVSGEISTSNAIIYIALALILLAIATGLKLLNRIEYYAGKISNDITKATK